METGKWHERLELPGRQTVVMHSATVMVQLPSWGDAEDWGSAQEARPRAVKRGLDGVACPEEGEPPQVDHVVFVVHGVGSACDLRLRTVEECREFGRGLVTVPPRRLAPLSALNFVARGSTRSPCVGSAAHVSCSVLQQAQRQHAVTPSRMHLLVCGGSHQVSVCLPLEAGIH